MLRVEKLRKMLSRGMIMPGANMGQKRGFLIVIEGIDGAGKSTQARVLHKMLKSLGFDAVAYREPTRGKWGREIKKLAKRSDSLLPEEELALFVKDREENVKKNLKPALARNKVIILDRYYFSTIAYQGAKGIDPARIKRMNEKFAVKPDLVFILDIDAGKGLARIHERKRKDLLFERKEYLAKVRKIFKSFQGRSIIHIDASRPKKEISAEISARVLQLLKR
jgi:dTMP kinase